LYKDLNRILSFQVGTIDTITRAKMKRRLVELKNDFSRLEKLVKVAKPSTFDLIKWKSDLQNEISSKT
jgi:hypothetical protein